jgi:hypothetical protein
MDPKTANRQLLAFISFVGACFLVSGILVQIGVMTLDPEDGPPHIIVGFLMPGVVPLMWLIRK